MKKLGIVCSKMDYQMLSLKEKLKEDRSIVVPVFMQPDDLSNMQEMDIYLLYADKDIFMRMDVIVFLRKKKVRNNKLLLVLCPEAEKESLEKLLPSSIIDMLLFVPDNLTNEGITDYTIELHKALKDTYDPQRRFVLVVDDSGIMLRNIKKTLGDIYEVQLANSGSVAFRFMYTRKPDLVLLDYEMPLMNGREVLERMRKDKMLKDIPVFFLTGHGDKDTLMDVMGLYPEGFILKAQGVQEVIKTVEAYFNKNKKYMLSKKY